MTIIGIIAVPLSEVVITYLINSAQINERMYESKDQQLAAQYWAQDVAGVGQRSTSTFGATAGINVANCTGFPGTKVISLTGSEYALSGGNPTPVTVTYSESGTALVRTRCATGSPTVSVTVANTIDTSTPITCSTTNGSTWVSCSGITGSSTDGVNQLELTFRVADSAGKGQPYTAILSGQRRQS